MFNPPITGDKELDAFSPTLAQRERWLVLNKADLLPEEEFNARCDELIEAMDWQGPVFKIAGINQQGTEELAGRLMDHLEAVWEAEEEDPEKAEAELEAQEQMQREARERPTKRIEIHIECTRVDNWRSAPASLEVRDPRC